MSLGSGILSAEAMGDSSDKLFSASLVSLQLQLKTLLEDSGGDGAVRLLDALGNVNQSEQKIILEVFNGVIDRLLSGDLRLETASDKERKELEENLYGEIINSIEQAVAVPLKKQLEVLDGGKCPHRHNGTGVLDLAKLRKMRKSGPRHLNH